MNYILFGSAIAILAMTSCKKEVTTGPTPPATVVEKPAVESCYKGILKEDTIAMTLIMKDNQIAEGSQLSYHLFEKDRNEGTLRGQMRGDTLFADYTFMSEGKESVREVAFLKEGDSFIEGYGNVVEKDGRMMFKDARKLKFDNKTILMKSECHK